MENNRDDIDRVESLIVLEEDENTRLDIFISKKLNISRSKVKKMIDENYISVNEENKIKPALKLEINDNVIVKVPSVKEVDLIPENIYIDIIYEDNDIAVINKQPWLVVHPGNGFESGTLVNAIMYHIKDLSGIGGEMRPGIVHRLDKNTSGLIIIAKNDNSHEKLSKMFHDREIKKTYIAIVKGKLKNKSDRIVTNIGRDRNDRIKMKALNPPQGKIAISNYKVIDENDLFSLVEINIETGRTHQIRVHMKYIGHPIVGDSVYGSAKDNERQMLHAYRLELNHPISNKKMIFYARLHEDFEKELKNKKLSLERKEK